MLGTRVDFEDAPRLVPSKFGWWFIGNSSWTLLAHDAVSSEGVVCEEAERFLKTTPAYSPVSINSYSLTVLTSTDCNLGCNYCYQNTELNNRDKFRPQRITRSVLDVAAIDRILKFAESRMHEAKLRELSLVIFGGEPLLNSRGCLNLLSRSKDSFDVTAAMVTNGVLLKTRLAIELYQAGLNAIQITLDGSKYDHDRIRAFRSGSPSYDVILGNVANAMKETRIEWQFRVNVSHVNFQRVTNVLEEVIDAGIDPKRCMILFAWIGDKGIGYDNSLKFSKEVRDTFVEWNITALRLGFHVPRPNMKRRCQTCTYVGGTYGSVVNADGSLYSCWQSAGKQGFELGDVENGYSKSIDSAPRWVSCGYEFSDAERSPQLEFLDEIDGRFLDYLHENGLLR